MKKILRGEWKVWFKTGYLPLLYLAAFLLLNFLAVPSLQRFLMVPQEYNFFYHYRNMQDHTLILFTVMAFTAFELFCIYSSSDIDEYTGIYSHRQVVMSAKLLVLLPLAALLFVLLLVYSLVAYFVSGSGSGDLLVQVCFAHFLNHFLPMVAACLLGSALGVYCSRLKGYVWLTLIIFLLSPLSMQAFVAIMHTGLSIEWLQRLTLIGSPNLALVPITLLGMPVDSQRWWLIVIWCAVPMVFLVRKLVARPATKRIMVFLLCTIALFGGWCSLLRDNSGLHIYEQYDSSINESVYATSVNHIVPTKTSDAMALSYDLEISVGHSLSAEAVISMDTVAETYDFTLDHVFTVISVTNEADDPLPYVQRGDYLTVTSLGAQTVHISYFGGSDRFYTNEQAVLLPAGFAYYPISGYHQIYGKDTMNISAMSPVTGGHADFTVRISAQMPLYSNLYYENGVYIGNTNGVTFIGGLVEETEKDGLCTVSSSAVPTPELQKDKIADRLRDTVPLFAAAADPEKFVDNIKTVFVLPEFSPFMKCAAFDDHILLPESGASTEEIASALLINAVSPSSGKQNLIPVYIDVMTSYDVREQALKMLESYEGVPRFTLDATRVMKLTMAYEMMGAENLRETVTAYLANGEEDMDQFLSHISGWDDYWKENRLDGGDV